jgi:signal transduction histidine kinase
MSFTTPSSSDRRARILDAALAAVTCAATIGLLDQGGVDASDARALDPLGVVLAGVATLPLALWRRSPLGVFVVTTSASIALMVLGFGPGPPFGPTASLYLLAASRDDTHPWTRGLTAVVGGLFTGHVVAVGIGQDEFPTVPLLLGSLVWAVAWFAGDRTRLRRERIAGFERQVERERRLAAVEERTRIARDLHDSAGHAINVILVQAGAARLLQERDPGASRAALETIEDVARQTLGEIDALVRTLRDDPSPNGQVTDAPGLAMIGTLVERHRAAGLDVMLESRGEPKRLATSADQAAYRIVQESLTNASRHGTGSAHVELAFDGRGLEVVVTNPVATGASPSVSGHGLTGMRERATLAGGLLEAGPAGGVFRVHARLPART